MTTERVKAIAWDIYDESCTPLDRIERAIRQAVNEALEDAEASVKSNEGDWALTVKYIQSLKLPEDI